MPKTTTTTGIRKGMPGESPADLRRLGHEYAVISDITRIVSSSLELEQVIEEFATRLNDLFEFDNFSVSLLAEDEVTLENLFVLSGRRVEWHSALATVLEVSDAQGRAGVTGRGEQPIAGLVEEKVLAIEEGLIFEPKDLDEVRRLFPQEVPLFDQGVRAIMSVPISWDGRVRGFLSLSSNRRGAFNARDLELAQTVSNQIAGSVGNTLMHAELRRESEERLNSEAEVRNLNVALERQVKELSALNSLFQEHIGERFEVAQAYSRFALRLSHLADEMVVYAERAQTAPIPERPLPTTEFVDKGDAPDH